MRRSYSGREMTLFTIEVETNVAYMEEVYLTTGQSVICTTELLHLTIIRTHRIGKVHIGLPVTLTLRCSIKILVERVQKQLDDVYKTTVYDGA